MSCIMKNSYLIDKRHKPIINRELKLGSSYYNKEKLIADRFMVSRFNYMSNLNFKIYILIVPSVVKMQI